MRAEPVRLAGWLLAVGVVCAAWSDVHAETGSLELKLLGSTPTADDYVVRSTSPQSFFMQFNTGDTRLPVMQQPGEKQFSEIVKKEPKKYVAKNPFKGVAKLGSHEYAFVFDESRPKKDDKAKEKDEDAVTRYTRLLFDLNRNGDLTDDEVIKAVPQRGLSGMMMISSFVQSSFPTVELTIEADGVEMDYAFTFSVYSNRNTYTIGDGEERTQEYASASLNAGAYREGTITLDGKEARVLLVDFNSNGLFNDASSVRDDVNTPDGKVYPQYGDMILIDPDMNAERSVSPYDVTAGGSRNMVGPLIEIGGKFHDLEISPSGDRLTLSPSKTPVGKVKNPNGVCRATVYGDQGILKIVTDEEGVATLPEGEWKLLSYTIDRTNVKKKEAAEGEEKEVSMMDRLLGALGPITATRSSGPKRTAVSATATRDYPSIKVVSGKTVKLPFGPPYKAVTTVPSYNVGDGTTYLQMAITGSAGELCTDLTINGSRPANPKFTINTAEGEEVHSAAFEYG